MLDKIIMFFKNKLVLIVISVIFAGLIGIISGKFLGDDNLIEEKSEDFINEKTGLKIDLTPDSQEVIIYDSNR